jgi:Rrf2 family transcriptional regulator, iron-sulfur cluster assembly transcription factor
VRLEVTRRADLALGGLRVLAHEGAKLKAAELAERLGTSPGFLSQAMTALVARGWVRSEPGPTGGYLLVADPRRLNALEVIEAVEGPTDTARCVLENRACAGAGGGLCALHQPWTRARALLVEELSATSLAD